MCYKWLSEHLMAIMFYTIQKKGLFTIAHKWLFHPAWAAPSSDGGGDRRLPQAIPARRPTNRHHHWLAWNSNFGKLLWRGNMMRKKLIGQIKWIERLKMCLWEHCLSRCQYYDITLFILINSEELALLVGNSPPVVVDLSLWRFALPCQL